MSDSHNEAEVDLSQLLRHAFLAGIASLETDGAKRGATDAELFATYSPEECPAYARVLKMADRR